MNALTFEQMEQLQGGESCAAYLAGLGLIIAGAGSPLSLVGLSVAIVKARDCATAIYNWRNG